jgi:hypothetical protein
MIRFIDDNSSNNKSKPKSLEKSLQNLLNIIYNNPEYYNGSYHENQNISDVIEIIYKVLFVEEGNNSLHLIIDKKPNNSMDITVDKIE